MCMQYITHCTFGINTVYNVNQGSSKSVFHRLIIFYRFILYEPIILTILSWYSKSFRGN